MATRSSTGPSASGRSTPKIPDVKSALNDIKGSVAQPFALPRRPKSDAEAQRLYYHIRTLCFWLDVANEMIKIPYLDRLPFSFGVESIIGGLLPIAGDIIGFFLSLYVVLLCMQFGLPPAALWKMFTNCIIDVMIGIIPIVGSILDFAFKSNLRNLQVLEDHLLRNSPPRLQELGPDGGPSPSTHFAVRIPPPGAFWPKSQSPSTESFYASFQAAHSSTSFFSNFFGSSANLSGGSGSTNHAGWKLGGVSKAQIEDVGGWTGEAAHMLWSWIVALLARISGKTGLTDAAGRARQKGNKKAY